ncbi:hypothetical protein SDC9_88975 [bioreactor metagenome]|jgi:hypothetical protein|uniref:Secretion system C-terminal sorting domain-containing protein n=1 Tax=bioreactor metagenome TaxID=1076179 RepID=A0A644ZMZ9_9ZZZZ
MKKIKLLFFLILSTGIILANPIDKETAKKVAINFMSNRISTSLTVKNVITEELNGQISFYVVNFLEGGWAMVSADNSAVPVLSFNLSGEYKLEDEKPESFIELTTNYKEQIASSKSLKSANGKISKDISTKWNNLLSESKLKSLKSYTPGSPLLDVSGRGHVQWSQDKNNDGGCSPSYNAYCPTGSGSSCDCDRKPAGCGAVVMGQIMWYWQWPQSSSYRTYNWGLMPDELTNSSTTAEGEEVAHLLKDCGDASDMTYWCSGSWTTVNKIEDAFKDKFNYKGVKKHVKNDWDYGSAWEDLLRSEIDNERPVFYRGDKSDLSTSKHFFVLDGYDASDPDYFHFNFGWGYPGNTYNTSFQYLNDITPGSHEYNKNQMAIVGISPTYTELAPDDINIFDVSYSSVTGIKNEEAQQDIALPATGKELTIENGGELILTAGNSITLKPGFHAKVGSEFTAQINPDYTEEMDISVPTWYNAFTPNGDGVNDEFCIDVENANSFEFEAFDRNGIPIFQSAGIITGNTACLWDGSGAYCLEAYACIIRFKNNYGRAVENAYMVSVICGLKSARASNDSLKFYTNEKENFISDIQQQNKEVLFTAYPNPNKGLLNLKFSNHQVNNIKIYNSQGLLCYQVYDIKQPDFVVDISSFVNGIYIISAELENQIITKKIILEK